MKSISSNILTARLITGLVQGLVLYLLFAASQSKVTWPATQPFVFVPILMIALFVPLLIIQGIGNIRPKILMIWGTLATLMLWGIAYYAVYRQIVPNVNSSFLLNPPSELLFLTSVALFIAQSFIVSGSNDNRYLANYTTYFNVSWKLGIQITFAILFTGLVWILLWLGAGLFKVIHLDFFEKIITQSLFAIPTTMLATAIALHITDVNERVVRGTRVLVLVLLSWLLLLITGIISAFLVSLVFTGLAPLWETNHSGLLSLIAATILVILINATYQDGEHEKPLLTLQRYAATLACCLLIPLMLIAAYALSLRVQQYGWSVDRIYAVLGMIILASYAIGYSLAACARPWLKLIERWNVGTALLMIAIYLAIFTPLADPARLTVDNQVARLQAGKISAEKFDFNALQSQGLRFGQQALQAMQTSWQGPEADLVRTRAGMALSPKSKANPLGLEDKNKLIIAHTKDGKLPKAFLEQDWQSVRGAMMIPTCLTDGSETCQAWVMTGNDKTPLIVILDSSNTRFSGFQQNTQGVWAVIGSWYLPYQCRDKLRDAAAKGQFKLVPPAQPDIEVMGVRVDFTPMRLDGCG